MREIEELLKFIKNSPSMFHTIETISKELKAAGFQYLPETRDWELKAGGAYYTTRNGSSLIAFKIGEEIKDLHFQITASHSDSPTYKIKHLPELEGAGGSLRLDVEGYGGMIDSSWFDRPLSVAGRVVVQEGNQICSRLINFDRELLLIPNVAIHFNRQINQGYAYNRQVDLCPLFSAGELKKGAFDALVAKELGVKPEQILGKDLYLVNRQDGKLWGVAEEFVSAPKLDDLECAYTSLRGFLEAENKESVNVYCCFDNEEVGSGTKQGALSTFLSDILHRISDGWDLMRKTGTDSSRQTNPLERTNKLERENLSAQERYYQAVAASFLVSCDNAHAVHPNHPEKTDAINCCFLNKGIVIKESANQKYTTDAVGRAVFTAICDRAGVPHQTFANRSDSPGGSTLGNLSNTQVSLNAVDIGLAQLAMHSSYETAGSKDVAYEIRALKAFYETNLVLRENIISFEK